jgi:hypothetical protein
MIFLIPLIPLIVIGYVIKYIIDLNCESFDPLSSAFAQVPGRLVEWFKRFGNIDFGYGIPAGIPQHLGPCPGGLNSRDIAGTCWAGKDICDVELPVCTGGCRFWWDWGPKAECTEIKCTSGSITNCPHITKVLTDRMTCGDKENVAGLCYDYCRSGYKKAPAASFWCIPDFW